MELTIPKKAVFILKQAFVSYDDSQGDKTIEIHTVLSLLEAPGAKTLPRALLFRAIHASLGRW